MIATNAPRHFLLALALRGVRGALFCFYLQPRFLQGFWGRIFGWVAYRLAFRRSVVVNNLALAFPGQLGLQAELLRKNYDHLGHLCVEIPLVLGPMPAWIARNCDLQGGEEIRRAQVGGKGILFLSSHLGNWEIMLAVGAVLGKVPLLMVTKRLKPSWLHAWIEQGRNRYGVGATYEPKTIKDVLRALKKNQAVGFVLDQYTGAPVGVRVPFFGVPVGTSLALATLAKRTGAVVLPVSNYRKPDGRLAVVIEKPCAWIKVGSGSSEGDLHRELAVNTAAYAAILERHIRAHPEQWLWTHRRFKGDLSPLRADEWEKPRVRKSMDFPAVIS